MKPTTRFRILEHIRKYQSATVRELSRTMGLTGANIRHHLAYLEKDGLIDVVSLRQEGRGRPMQVYGLSLRVLGDGMDHLAGALLSVWLNRTKAEDMEAGLRSIAEGLAGSSDVKAPMVQRLARAVERLNELRYQARWEAGPVGAHVILGHCPYAALITAYPELCRMDAILLEMRLCLSVTQIAKLQLNDKGLPFCAFDINSN
jgi:predicted ArsR family transcriptional regulator